MSRRFKKSRSQKVKRSVNIVLLTIYLLLVGFSLFLIFKYNILAFRHVNIVVAVFALMVAVKYGCCCFPLELAMDFRKFERLSMFTKQGG